MEEEQAVTKPEELKWWWFDTVEQSNGVWRVTGIDQRGRTVTRVGIDPEEILRQCYEDALYIQRQVEEKRQERGAENPLK